MIERDLVKNNILDELRELRGKLEKLERFAVTALGEDLKISGDFFYDGDLRAQRGLGAFTGYIFVPITPVQLTDTGSTVWNGSATRNVGTYNFDLQDAVNGGIPAEAVAVAIRISGVQTAGASNYMAVRGRGLTTDFPVGHICNVGTYACGSSGICAVDGVYHGIEAVVAGANATSCYAVMYGYWI